MRTHSSILGSIPLFILAIPLSASAENRHIPFTIQTSERIQSFPWSSQFVPADRAIQFQVVADASQDVDLELSGSATYESTRGILTFEGLDSGGTLRHRLGAGVQIVVRVGFPDDTPWVGGLNTEFEIDAARLQETTELKFTPYVLGGEAVGMSQSVGPATLVDRDFELPTTSSSGHLRVTYRLEFPQLRYSGVRIDLATDPQAQDVVASFEGDPLEMPFPERPLYARAHATIDARSRIVFSAQLELGGDEPTVTLGPIDIATLEFPLLEGLPLTPAAVELDFGPAPVTPPPLPEPRDPEGDLGTTGDDAEAFEDTGSSGASPESPAGTDESGSGSWPGESARLGSDADASGCACSTTRRRSPWGPVLALVVGVVVRRRRRIP